MLDLDKKQSCAAVILAAGAFTRMRGINKQLAVVGGMPVMAHTLLAFESCGEIDEIVLVSRPEDRSEFEALAVKNAITKLSRIVDGGATRLESSLKGVSALDRFVRFAAIHDGARALVTPQLIGRVVRQAKRYGAAVPAVPVNDTIKKANGGMITDTLDRGVLFIAQTPQVFDAALIKGALHKAVRDGADVTDDSQAAERIGMRVCLTEGDYENIKVTTPGDLLLAEAILERRPRA